MFGLQPKLRITDEERQWVDEGFARLEKLLGRQRMLRAKVILPTAEHFPDFYDKTPATAEVLFERVCFYMDVERGKLEFEIFADETEELREILPYWRNSTGRCAAGLYTHHEVDQGSDGDKRKRPMVVAVRSTQLNDPMSLVATVAHELGHVILLGGELIDRNTPDHEPLTDLLTVFLRLGIFTANSAARFLQFQDERKQGWSMQRLGYLPEEVYGYALAKFATERNEDRPDWVRHLSTNVRAYCKRSLAYLQKSGLKPTAETIN
jgi:hypothetical protein